MYLFYTLFYIYFTIAPGMALKLSVRVLLAIFVFTVIFNFYKMFKDPAPQRPSEYIRQQIRGRELTTYSSLLKRWSVDWEDMLTCIDNSTTDASETVPEVINDTLDLELCPNVPPNLGPVGTGESMVNLASIQNIYNELTVGGVYKGKQCKARQAVAIIVPYSGTKKHLNPFLPFIHPFLMKQQLEYQVFVIEFSQNVTALNRGQLFNVGVMEAQKYRPEGWDCLILHDADLLPWDLRNLYRCSWYPRIMNAVTERTNKSPTYRRHTTDERLSGGAISITPEHFKKANGFSNHIVDRDLCYEDFYNRLTLADLIVEKNNKYIGLYRVMKYVSCNWTSNTFRFRKSIFVPTRPTSMFDGMNTTVYKLKSIRDFFFYTSINVSNVTVYPFHTDINASSSSDKTNSNDTANEFTSSISSSNNIETNGLFVGV